MVKAYRVHHRGRVRRVQFVQEFPSLAEAHAVLAAQSNAGSAGVFIAYHPTDLVAAPDVTARARDASQRGRAA